MGGAWRSHTQQQTKLRLSCKVCSTFAFALVCECVCVWHLAALQGKINPLALINLPYAILIKKYRNTTILQLMYYLLFLSIKKILIFPICIKKNKTKTNTLRQRTIRQLSFSKFVACFGSLLLTANCCAKKHLTPSATTTATAIATLQ